MLITDNEKASGKIMIVDDNIMNIIVNRNILGTLPFDIEIIEASNGQEALDLFLTTTPEIKLILMDCEMPIMNGYESSKLIREYSSKVVIIGVSGNSGKVFTRKCKLNGMDDTISKPINF
jgi:CheY-like chemotaxis protein